MECQLEVLYCTVTDIINNLGTDQKEISLTPLCSVGFQRVTQPVQKTFFDIMFDEERVEI